MSSSCPAASENGCQDGIKMAKQDGAELAKQDGIEMAKQDGAELAKQDGIEMAKQDDAKLAKQDGQRSAENVDPPAPGSRQYGGSGLFGLSRDNKGTLVVVATLITTLSYQVGSNIPGGYWDGDEPGHHRAGEPIMRTQRLRLYYVFICSSWVGFSASMGLTLALLTGVPPRSRLVRGLFVLSYSALIISYVTQQAFSIIWVSLLVWVAVVVFITCAINSSTHPYLRRFFDWLCMEPASLKHPNFDQIVPNSHHTS